MIIRSLVLHNFARHEETSVDYDGARFIVYSGPNGAGKSTLACHAVEYALYGKVGSTTADELVRRGELDMASVVTFALGEMRYRIARGRTLRSGGRSFLELAAWDGGAWRALTGSTQRETQESIVELLRLDQDAFRSAVLLGQGDIHRFAEATAADRKQVLGTAIGLDVYARAEAIAREQARDAGTTVAAHRTLVDHLAEQLSGREDLEADAERLAAELGRIEANETQSTDRRDEAEAQLRQLERELAGADAAEAEVSRLEAELVGLKSRWQRVDHDIRASQAAIARAQAVLQDGPTVAVAIQRLEPARAACAAADAAGLAYRDWLDSIHEAEAELSALEATAAEVVAEHKMGRHRLEDRIRSLEEQKAGLLPLECPACGERFAADPGDLAGRLEVARHELSEYPAPPAELEGIAELRSRVLALHQAAPQRPDAADITRLRTEVLDVERMAARVGEIRQARGAQSDSHARLQVASDEQKDIDRAARASKVALVAARDRAVGAIALRERQAAEERVLDASRVALTELAKLRTTAQAAIARAQAEIERLERLAAEHADAEQGLATAEQQHGRLRRLVEAFGVKGIPARIIEGVLPELGRYANDLLADLRPGMTLELRAQRPKKAGEGVIEALDLIVRDEDGEGPLHTFSGGERTSVSLALAVGLSRLVARRSGASIRSLLIDEPDGLDEPSRRAFGQGVKVLAHRGGLDRVVVISHHDDLAEHADRVIRVEKRSGRSVLLDEQGDELASTVQNERELVAEAA